MNVSLEEIAQLECEISNENFDSIAEALETAFPFLKPFRNTLGCCAVYICPGQKRISPEQLEYVITEWQSKTSMQMVGSFSISINRLLGNRSKETGETTEFNPADGVATNLCKLTLFMKQKAEALIPCVRIHFLSTGSTKFTQIMAFAAIVDATTLQITLKDESSIEVSPADLV